VRPYVYVGAMQSNGRPEILVLRRRDFGLVARLPAPVSSDECVYGCYKGVVVVGASEALFVANGLNAEGTRPYRFRLPPAAALP
jgi:hypothetical protein